MQNLYVTRPGKHQEMVASDRQKIAPVVSICWVKRLLEELRGKQGKQTEAMRTDVTEAQACLRKSLEQMDVIISR